MQGMKYKDICDKYDLSINTLKSWIKRYDWSNKRKARNKKGAPKKKRGAPLNNKNAVGNSGGAAPIGNINSIKHGAYQSLYADMLNTEDKILFNMIQPSINIDDEIKLLRLKIARLLNREKKVDFGQDVEKEISESARINGINACMDQLRKLIETKTKTLGDTEKLQLEKDKFEFNKYKTDIDLQLKKERLQLEKDKIGKNKNDKPIEILITRKGEGK